MIDNTVIIAVCLATSIACISFILTAAIFLKIGDRRSLDYHLETLLDEATKNSEEELYLLVQALGRKLSQLESPFYQPYKDEEEDE